MCLGRGPSSLSSTLCVLHTIFLNALSKSGRVTDTSFTSMASFLLL